jgi:hypothetical protein
MESMFGETMPPEVVAQADQAGSAAKEHVPQLIIDYFGYALAREEDDKASAALSALKIALRMSDMDRDALTASTALMIDILLNQYFRHFGGVGKVAEIITEDGGPPCLFCYARKGQEHGVHRQEAETSD